MSDWLRGYDQAKHDIREELAALLDRLVAASKSDEHNGAVIVELKRQLTEAVQERNVAHAAGFREGWETCICIIRKVSEEYHGTATERTSTDLCEERIRALLDQPDDRKEG